MKRLVLGVALAFLPEQAALSGQQAGDLFEEVYEVLSDDYYDRSFRRRSLPRIADKYRPLALRSRSLKEERRVIHNFLSEIPASHLALYSERTYANMLDELSNVQNLTYGFQIVQLEGRHFVHTVLEGGPAAKAGLKSGDRVLTLQNEPVSSSPYLDWRSDDAYLPDPPIHAVLCSNRTPLWVMVERQLGQILAVQIDPEEYSAFEAAKASARVIEVGGRRLAYLHFWFVHFTGTEKLLRELIRTKFKDCDGMLLDLRGRGGSAAAVYEILSVFGGKRAVWNRPMVALVDSYSRSAKEVLASEIQERQLGWIVGEATAGAVIPATFEPVGKNAVLMFPSTTLGKMTNRLEGNGVSPDVEVTYRRPFSKGADPILEAGKITLQSLLQATRDS